MVAKNRRAPVRSMLEQLLEHLQRACRRQYRIPMSKRRAVLFVLLVAVAALSCGKVSPITSDSDAGVPTCVFGNDTFDDGCTFGP